MANYSVVNVDGLITNRIVVDDEAELAKLETPAGALIIAETDEPYAIGGTYIDGVYTPPTPTIIAPPAAVQE